MIDPYGIKQGDTAWDIGNYANTWEVTVLPTVDKSKEYAALYPQLRGLLEDLKHVQPREMSHEQRLAFWINIYHSLILHAHLLFGVPKTHYKRINFMNKVAYIVGGHLYSVLAIEHSVLRAHSHRPALVTSLFSFFCPYTFKFFHSPMSLLNLLVFMSLRPWTGVVFCSIHFVG
jgi:hypothetical protein